MSISQNLVLQFGAIETIALEGAGSPRASYTEFDRPIEEYNATSDPAVTKLIIDKLTLTGSLQNLDLTAAPNSRGVAEDLTGLKIVTALLYNPNENPITIGPGSATPYLLFGSGNSIVLPPGGRFPFDFRGELADVSGTVKFIGITGTAADELWYEMTAG